MAINLGATLGATPSIPGLTATLANGVVSYRVDRRGVSDYVVLTWLTPGKTYRVFYNEETEDPTALDDGKEIVEGTLDAPNSGTLTISAAYSETPTTRNRVVLPREYFYIGGAVGSFQEPSDWKVDAADGETCNLAPGVEGTFYID